MPKYKVTVEKTLRVSGTITVDAGNAEAATQQVRSMMNNVENPLQTTDPRISWDEPEYEDNSLVTYGDVDEV